MRRLAFLSAGVCLALASCEKPAAVKAAPKVVVPAPPQGFARVWADEPLSADELELLIEDLDTAARLRKGIELDLANLLMANLGNGVPKSMTVSSWHHFFNSSLNALGATPGVSREAISRILIQVVDDEDDKVLRLYSLQHLGIHQPSLSEPLRSELGRRVSELAYFQEDEVSGTALELVEQWNGELGAGLDNVPVEDRSAAALKIMTDANRPMDVRISAMHVAADGGFQDALPRRIVDGGRSSTKFFPVAPPRSTDTGWEMKMAGAGFRASYGIWLRLVMTFDLQTLDFRLPPTPAAARLRRRGCCRSRRSCGRRGRRR